MKTKILNNRLKVKEKSKIKLLLQDIKEDLNKSKKRISYQPYINKYGFTKNEIAFYIKGAKLSKKVYNHNQRIKW